MKNLQKTVQILPFLSSSLDKNPFTIAIPKKLVSKFKRITSKKEWSQISSSSKQYAMECCYYFCNLLFIQEENKFKKLSSKLLKSTFSTSVYQYKIIIDFLSKHGIIEIDNSYQKQNYSKSYRLTPHYFESQVQSFELKTSLKDRLNRFHKKEVEKNSHNPICVNLIKVKELVTYPTTKEILKEAKRLVFNHTLTKKGKRLVFQSEYIEEDHHKVSFIETSIQLFERLKISNLTPRIGNYRSGGRLVDMFVLMPSWIRPLCLINNKKIVQVDCSCFHPNIAINLYGGNSKFLTHKQIADELNISVKDAKIEHLSFFNKKIWQMKSSVLFEYYKLREPEMLDRIIKEKKYSKEKHKITSQKLFDVEVRIMSEYIKRLNAKNIYVLYVYDAIYVEYDLAPQCAELLNSILLEFEVYTKASIG